MAIYDINGNTLTPLESKWNGKIASFIGDSITDGTITLATKHYWEYLKDMAGFATVNDCGTNGARIAGSGIATMWEKASTVPSNSDIVFVLGGTNDFNASVALGEWYTLSGTTRSFTTDTSTFKGAINQMCLTLMNRFYNKRIVLMTPLHRMKLNGQQYSEMEANSLGKYLEEYAECIREACKMFSLTLIDLYSDSGLFSYSDNNNSLYYNGTDRLHPNAKGHERMAQVIYERLKTLEPTS